MAPRIFKTIKIVYSADMKMADAEHFVIPTGNRFMIYVPRKGICALVNKEFIEKIKTKDKTVKALFNYIKAEKAVALLGSSTKPCFNMLTLFLTGDCNLRCSYCYASGGERPLWMDWDTARTAIEHCIKNCRGDEFRLYFHGGGEPTLAFPMMKRCYNHAAELCDAKGIKLKVGCGTNGILNEEQINWMASVNMRVAISMDGPPDIQNNQRPLKNGGPSYPIVRRTIERFNALGMDYAVSCVFNKKCEGRMVEIIKHLNSLGVKEVGISPSYACGRCGATDVPDVTNFMTEYKKCFDVAEKAGMNLSAILKNSLSLGNTGCAPSLIVTPDGYISSCYFVSNAKTPLSNIFMYGIVKNSKVLINQKKLNYLKSRTISRISGCQNCFCKWNCAGNCPYRAAICNGTVFSPFKESCLANQGLIKYLLERLLEGDIGMAGFDFVVHDIKI